LEAKIGFASNDSKLVFKLTVLEPLDAENLQFKKTVWNRWNAKTVFVSNNSKPDFLN
jgi:hypothetical protein